MKKKIILAFEDKINNKLPLIDKIKLRTIQVWTKSPYFHVEIIADNKWAAAYTSGLQVKDVHKFSNSYEYYSIEVDVCEEQEKRINEFLNSINGEPYDMTGLYWRQGFNIGRENKNAWFCSEIVNKILQLYLVKPFIRLESSTSSPGDIYNYIIKRSDLKKLTASELNKIYGFEED